MGTATELRRAGISAIVTAVLLTGALLAVRGGPPVTTPARILSWHADYAGSVRAGALLWLLAMLALVVFAVKLREAMWASTADRSWTTVLFIQGATVFATVAVAAAAVGWSLAQQAEAGTISAPLASTLWTVEQTLLRFGTWGFTVPLGVVAYALYRHSLLGRLCAAVAVLLAVALLVPPSWAVAVHAFPVWLLVTALALIVPRHERVPQPARDLQR